MQLPRLLVAGAWVIAWTCPLMQAQATAELVGPMAEIPRERYQTWSLFLICNPDWVASSRSAELAHLYQRFRSFGDAIGRDNLAVWFWKRRGDVNDPQLAANVDVARSAEYCRVLGRAPSEGPYLVVTNSYPDLAAFPAERAVFALGAAAPAELAKLLNTLTDQLLLQGRVSPASPAPGGEPQSLWIRLLEGARQSLIGFACTVKLQIHTGLLTAELRACAGPGA